MSFDEFRKTLKNRMLIWSMSDGTTYEMKGEKSLVQFISFRLNQYLEQHIQGAHVTEKLQEWAEYMERETSDRAIVGVCAGIRVECLMTDLRTTMYMTNIPHRTVLDQESWGKTRTAWTKSILHKAATMFKYFQKSTLHCNDEFNSVMHQFCDMIKYTHNVVYYYHMAIADPIHNGESMAISVHYCNELRKHYCSYQVSTFIWPTYLPLPSWIYYLTEQVYGDKHAVLIDTVPLRKIPSIAEEEFMRVVYSKNDAGA